MTQAERKWDEDELELFQAGRAEAPPAGSADSVLAALGLEGPMGPMGGEEAPVSGLEPVKPPSAPPPAPAPPASGIFARPLALIGGGVILALVPAAILMTGGDKQAAPAPASKTVEVEEVAAESGEGEAAADPSLEAEVATTSLEDLPLEEKAEEQAAVRPAASKAAVKPQTDGAESAARPSLKEELAIIKKARTSLNSGNLAGAEAALAEHRAKFNPPRLSSEARVIRVEILMKQGKKSQARQVAAPLMKENSPYRARMETLLSTP